jgi:hypothetical protein
MVAHTIERQHIETGIFFNMMGIFFKRDVGHQSLFVTAPLPLVGDRVPSGRYHFERFLVLQIR